MSRNNLFGVVAVTWVLLLTPAMVMGHSGFGPCVDCHIMHDSQNGNPVNPDGPQPTLLKFSCIGCHAYTTNLPATGRADSSGGPAAPQVGPMAGTGGVQLSGGYFSTGGASQDGQTHNVSDLFTATSGADSLMQSATAPGGTFPTDNGFGGAVLSCKSCHDLAIGHAAAGSARSGNATSSYRMLHRGTRYVVGTGDSNFEAGSGQNTYNADSMNKFCATCHGGFHGLPNTDSNGNGTGAWVRHPTDVNTSVYAPKLYTGDKKVVPVGTVDGTGAVDGAGMVMCLSCHRPHGNANADMLRFAYDGTANAAGDLVESVGCETCHGMK